MDGKQTSGKQKIKIIIIILSILLAVSLTALAGALLYKHFYVAQPVSVLVPDNIITPEEGKTNSLKADDSGSETPSESQPESEQSGAVVTATALSLHKRNADDNTQFSVGNMFPGDSETKYYCVRVSHKGDVILRFHADVRPGYEKLSEVLCCRIALPENGEVLYEGLMRDMPDELNRTLRTSSSTTSEVYYEITAYLDTGIGNEYMNKELIADFRFWVEETENLVSPPTGAYFNIYLWLCIASGSLFLLILLWRRRKKEDETNEG